MILVFLYSGLLSSWQGGHRCCGGAYPCAFGAEQPGAGVGEVKDGRQECHIPSSG